MAMHAQPASTEPLSGAEIPNLPTPPPQTHQMDSTVTTASTATAAAAAATANRQNLAFPKLNEIRRPPTSTNETKVIYHLEDKDCPNVIKIPISPDSITLRDLKSFLSLPKSHFKYYFKSFDKDVGVVKEQIFDDNSTLPLFQGNVVAFIESAESSRSPCTEMMNRISRPDGCAAGSVQISNNKRRGLVSDTFHPSDQFGDSTTETESMISSRRGGQYQSPRHRAHCKSNHHQGRYGSNKCNNRYHHGGNLNHHHGGHYVDSSVVTSDMESYVDSDDDYDDDFVENDVDSDDDYDDYSSRISTTTDETSVSRQYARDQQRMRRRYKPKYRNDRHMSRTSSISSFSQMSLNVITVNLNLDVVNYLGISLVGQTSQKGDGGIYVSSIMKGGAVDLDGRIEPGDMILQVNDTNFDQLTNDEAVQVIREAVKKPGPIKLLVAKCWDPQPKGHFTIPRSEPVRPIDPGAWVAHTEAARAKYTNHETNLPLNGSTTYASNSLASSITETDRQLFQQPQATLPSVTAFATASNSFPMSSASSVSYPTALLPGSPLRSSFKSGHSVTIAPNPATAMQVPSPPLTVDTNLETIACSMASPDSGLEMRERMWLKIRIPNAIIGSDVVQWLFTYVQGFRDRKEAKKFASKLLKQGYIRHTLKNSFSEKCYYVFSDSILQRVTPNAHDYNSVAGSNGINQALLLEDDFHNGLRLTNENQHFAMLNSEIAASNQLPLKDEGQTKPGMYMMPFMRYWDETSEIHNYGLFGPQAGEMNSGPPINDGNGSNHSGGVGRGNCAHDPYQSDEQMSQRSGHSVLFNPHAAQNVPATNTIASSGSNGSRHTNTSSQQVSASIGNAISTGNILNHHYEDLQINPVTGSLVPTRTNGFMLANQAEEHRA